MPPEPDARERRAAITAAIVCVAVVGVGLSLSIPLLSIEMARRGASSTLVGTNAALAGLAGIVTVPFVPRLAGRVGVWRLLVLAIGLGAACLVAFPLVPSLAWWFPLRFLFSMSLGALFVLSEFWIGEAAPPDRRGLVMGIYATVLALGLAAGPVLLSAVGTQGLPPYLVGAGLFLAGMLPLALVRGLSPEIGGAPDLGIAGYLGLAPAAILAALVYGAVETGGFAILPLYGLRLGYDAETAAGLVSALALGGVVFQIPFGWLADRVDRRLVLAAASLGSGFGAVLIPAASASPPLLLGLLFVCGGLVGTLYPVGLAHLGASAGGTALAGANAVFVVFYNAGLILGPPLVGGGLDLGLWGFAAALAALPLAYGLGLALSLARRGRP